MKKHLLAIVLPMLILAFICSACTPQGSSNPTTTTTTAETTLPTETPTETEPTTSPTVPTTSDPVDVAGNQVNNIQSGLLTEDAEAVYFWTDDGLQRKDKSSGATSAICNERGESPIVYDEYLYYTVSDPEGETATYRIRLSDSKREKIMDNHASSMAIVENTLYAVTGTELRTYQLDGTPLKELATDSPSPGADADPIYFTIQDSFIYFALHAYTFEEDTDYVTATTKMLFKNVVSYAIYGGQLYYAVHNDGTSTIYRSSLNGGETEKIYTISDEETARFTVSGGYIYIEDLKGDLFRLSLDGTGRMPVE